MDFLTEPVYDDFCCIPLEWINESNDEQLIELEEKLDEISLFKALAEYIQQPVIKQPVKKKIKLTIKKDSEEKRKAKERKERKQKKLQKDLKRSREMGLSLEEYNNLDISIRDKRKRARKSDVSPPVKGVNFSYPEGISLIFKDNNFLTAQEVTCIGKNRGYWSHKLQRSIDGKCQVKAAVSLTLRKMVIKKELNINITNSGKCYYKPLIL